MPGHVAFLKVVLFLFMNILELTVGNPNTSIPSLPVTSWTSSIRFIQEVKPLQIPHPEKSCGSLEALPPRPADCVYTVRALCLCGWDFSCWPESACFHSAICCPWMQMCVWRFLHHYDCQNFVPKPLCLGTGPLPHRSRRTQPGRQSRQEPPHECFNPTKPRRWGCRGLCRVDSVEDTKQESSREPSMVGGRSEPGNWRWPGCRNFLPQSIAISPLQITFFSPRNHQRHLLPISYDTLKKCR